MTRHEVVTRDFPENLIGGIMICGINFGYSKAEEAKEAEEDYVVVPDPADRSLFSDELSNRGRFVQRILNWFHLWGVDLAKAPVDAGPFERSFFQTNWLNTQSRSIDSEDKINISYLVEHAESFLNLLEERQPRMIVFVGASLIEALNDIRMRSLNLYVRLECFSP